MHNILHKVIAFPLHIVFITEKNKPNQWNYGIFLWVYFFRDLVLSAMHFPITNMILQK